MDLLVSVILLELDHWPNFDALRGLKGYWSRDAFLNYRFSCAYVLCDVSLSTLTVFAGPL